MNGIEIAPIGKIVKENGHASVVLDKKWAKGLKGLAEHSHALVLWWMDRCDNPTDRSTLVERKPYKNGPDEIGVFALRSPERPNPIAVSNAEIAFVDETCGILGLRWLDAFEGSDVLDIKPYTPSIDRVESPSPPRWCRHWPKSCEGSAAFDWAAEFNF